MKKLILFIVAIISIAIMFYFSSRNAEISSCQSQFILDIIRNFGFETNSYYIRKFAHFIIFVIIGICVSMFIGSCIESNILTVILSFILSSNKEESVRFNIAERWSVETDSVEPSCVTMEDSKRKRMLSGLCFFL